MEMAGGGFSVIVGNPPHIRIQNMVAFSPEEVAYYQRGGSPFTTTRQDNFDKYALFIERSLSLVRPDGRIGMIVPHKFMTIHAGRALRGLLSRDALLEEIVHFGVKQVFGRGTSNYTCIMVLNRAGCDAVRLEKAGLLKGWRYGQEGPVSTIPASELGAAPWEFADEEARTLFARIQAIFPARLSALADIEVGVQTSADRIYIIRPDVSDADCIAFQRNNQDWRIERDILRPCLHNAPVYAYVRPEANAWLIFPYELVANAGDRLRARLIQPDEMAAQYPGCWAYLNARREELENRNIVGGPVEERQWYQFGRSQSLTKFDRPKIILRVLSVEPRYGYDETNTLFTGGGNGPYYMVRARDDVDVSTLYLLAVLNHPLSEAFIRTNTSPFRGGYYSHGKQFIENLPIPVPNDEQQTVIETLATRLIMTIDCCVASRTPHEQTRKDREANDLRVEIEQRVSAVFGLSAEDFATAQSVPIPA